MHTIWHYVLFSGQGLHSCQRSSKRYHVCWASGEHFEIWICNEGKLLMCFVCRVLERPPRALSSPITIRRRDGKRPLFAQILSGHLKTFFSNSLNVILGLALTTNWSKMQPKQESLFMDPTQRCLFEFKTEGPEWFILHLGWPCCYCKWWCRDVQRRGTELKQS